MIKKLEYLLVKFFYEILRRIPFALSYYFAKFLAFILQYIIRYRKDVIKNNLNLAFPDLTGQKLKKITTEVYQNFACFFVELLQSWRINKEFMQKNFTVHNWEIMEQAFKEDKGVILVTGHLANVEWGGVYVSAFLDPVNAIMKPIHNPYLNDLVMQVRNKMGYNLLFTGNAYKKGLEVLRRSKGILGVIGDQDAREHGVFVDFFDHPASTAKGAAILHIKTGAPIIVGVALRRGWGKVDIHFERLDANNDIFSITQAHTKILEKWIKKNPGQYLWTHKRWKTKPDAHLQ